MFKTDFDDISVLSHIENRLLDGKMSYARRNVERKR